MFSNFIVTIFDSSNKQKQNKMKTPIINIEHAGYGQYNISTEIEGKKVSAYTTNSRLVDIYKDEGEDIEVHERAAFALYGFIYQANRDILH